MKHDPRLTAISQGDAVSEKEGKTVFTFDHDMPGISLCVGNYKRRAIMVDSTRLLLYYMADHEYLLERYDIISEDSMPVSLSYIKDRLENEECIQTPEFVMKYAISKYTKKKRRS